jgi:hypothetical protein
LHDSFTDVELLEYWIKQGKTEEDARKLLMKYKDKYKATAKESRAT